MTVSRPGPWREDGFDPAPPTAKQMAEQEAILADQLAAGWPGPPPGELVDFCPDPDTGLPEGDHAALGELPAPAEMPTQMPTERPAAPPSGACPPDLDDVITHDGRGQGGPG